VFFQIRQTAAHKVQTRLPDFPPIFVVRFHIFRFFQLFLNYIQQRFQTVFFVRRHQKLQQLNHRRANAVRRQLLVFARHKLVRIIYGKEKKKRKKKSKKKILTQKVFALIVGELRVDDNSVHEGLVVIRHDVFVGFFGGDDVNVVEISGNQQLKSHHISIRVFSCHLK
jgi:hypothetical protein